MSNNNSNTTPAPTPQKPEPLLSDKSMREINEILGPAMSKIAKVIVKDLDLADGKADQMVQKSSILQKVDAFQRVIGASEREGGNWREAVKAALKNAPESIPAADVLGALQAGISSVYQPIVPRTRSVRTND